MSKLASFALSHRPLAESFWDRQADVVEGEQRQRETEGVIEDAVGWLGDVNGRRVLDVGCGTGYSSLLLAERGANVVALDSSARSIDRLKRASAALSLGRVEAHVEDALRIDEHGPFDAVLGLFILHHVEPFDVFARRLRGTLKPGGRAFFWENNAVPMLMWFRSRVVGRFWIPKFGDDDETPLSPQEVDLLRNHFEVKVTIPETLLFRLVSSYVLQRRCAGVCERLDRWAHEIRPFRRLSYRQYVMLQG